MGAGRRVLSSMVHTQRESRAGVQMKRCRCAPGRGESRGEVGVVAGLVQLPRGRRGLPGQGMGAAQLGKR